MPINLDNPELALNGGTPVRSKPWSNNITTGQEEIDATVQVLKEGNLSLFEGAWKPDEPFSFLGGPRVQELEADWCSYYDTRYSVSVNSATSGLYMAIGALGIGYGDEVIVQANTMTACGIAPLVYGAIPVFADVELETGCMSVESIEERISERTKAILLVHLHGVPADMDPILELASKHNIKVIEDCAQAHGAKYKGRNVGTMGDIGVFSLNVNKAIQTGEGGVCITNDDDLYLRLCLIRNHAESVVGATGLEDITNMLGFNYRLTEIQAAIAIEQLKKLGELTKVRLDLLNYLNEQLAEYDFITRSEGRVGCDSTYYAFPLRFDRSKADITKEAFVEAINAEGMTFYTNYGSPLHMQPIYQKRQLFKQGYPFSAPANSECRIDYSEDIVPNTNQLYYEELIVNEHIRPPHTRDDMDDIIKAFEKLASS